MAPVLRTHGIVLRDRDLILRPLTERDWPLLYRWNRDREVLYYAEIDDAAPRTLEETQDLYRSVSRTAYCFIMKTAGREIGECWLQEMNLERILRAHEGSDCRRIDIIIGEATFRGHGFGTRAIALLSAFAFEREHADLVFGLVGEHNPRSVRAFESNGFTIKHREPEPSTSTARYTLDLALSRSEYEARGGAL